MLSFSSPSVEITPKTSANCLRGRAPQAPARAQSPARNTRIKRRKFRRYFVGYFDVPESRVFTSEFLIRAPYGTGTYSMIQCATCYGSTYYGHTVCISFRFNVHFIHSRQSRGIFFATNLKTQRPLILYTLAPLPKLLSPLPKPQHQRFPDFSKY